MKGENCFPFFCTFQVMKQLSFGKTEKLCSHKRIEELFVSGQSFLCYPVKTIWMKFEAATDNQPVQVAFSVPKRLFKRAHDRNRLKRLMRESYRLSKPDWVVYCRERNLQIVMMMVYVGKEIHDFNKIRPAITSSLSRLRKAVEQDIKLREDCV